MYMNTENPDYHPHKEIGDLFKITLRQGEIEAEERVSYSDVAEKDFLPFHYAKGTAGALTNSGLDTVAKIPKCKVCAAMLPDLH